MNVKLSIITATYNSKKTIPRLINVFKRSKKKTIEWIIIDNESVDGTIEIIKNSLEVVDKFISEKDTGIYDAWNKGVSISKGDYISFIGSDDLISETYFDEALRAIEEHSSHNIIGFKILYNYGNKSKQLNHLNYIRPNNYPVNLGFYHPGTLHSKELFKRNRFDINFKIAGDREFLTRVFYKLNPIIVITDKAQIIHYHGGVSTKNKNKIIQHWEVLKILLSIKNKKLITIYNLIVQYLKYNFYKFQLKLKK